MNADSKLEAAETELKEIRKELTSHQSVRAALAAEALLPGGLLILGGLLVIALMSGKRPPALTPPAPPVTPPASPPIEESPPAPTPEPTSEAKAHE